MAINLTKHLVILVNCICLSISSFPSCVLSTYMRFSKKKNAENNFYLIWNANAKWHTTTSFDRSWRSSNKLHHRIVPPLHFGGAQKMLHFPNYIYLCKEFFPISISISAFLFFASCLKTPNNFVLFLSLSQGLDIWYNGQTYFSGGARQKIILQKWVRNKENVTFIWYFRTIPIFAKYPLRYWRDSPRQFKQLSLSNRLVCPVYKFIYVINLNYRLTNIV